MPAERQVDIGLDLLGFKRRVTHKGRLLFDIGGRRVASIPLGTLRAGTQSMTLAETRKISGGIYFLRLTRGSATETRRVCFVR